MAFIVALKNVSSKLRVRDTHSGELSLIITLKSILHVKAQQQPFWQTLIKLCHNTVLQECKCQAITLQR